MESKKQLDPNDLESAGNPMLNSFGSNEEEDSKINTTIKKTHSEYIRANQQSLVQTRTQQNNQPQTPNKQIDYSQIANPLSNINDPRFLTPEYPPINPLHPVGNNPLSQQSTSYGLQGYNNQLPQQNLYQYPQSQGLGTNQYPHVPFQGNEYNQGQGYQAPNYPQQQQLPQQFTVQYPGGENHAAQLEYQHNHESEGFQITDDQKKIILIGIIICILFIWLIL